MKVKLMVLQDLMAAVVTDVNDSISIISIVFVFSQK